MSTRLANHLSAARHSLFVGRASEQELFASALTATELPFFVLYIYGPGGVGKTTLLREFASIAAEAEGCALYYLDARNLEPSPEVFREGLRQTMGLSSEVAPEDAMAAHSGRVVLLIDTYELLTPLDSWLRETFLPNLSENVLVVLAGRQPLAPDWHDAGWQALIRSVSLRNLSPEESLSLLDRRQVPVAQRQSVLEFTHGHPLALSLVADVFAQREGFVFQPEQTPDIVKTLLEKFVQKVPGPAHRAALEACALVRVLTEGLLAEMLVLPEATASGTQAVYELFEWLRGLSFVDARPGGIYPHDLARDSLTADLRWRNPDWYAELHSRARAYYTRRISQTTGEQQQRALLDLVYLHRDNPAVRPFFEWQASGGAVPMTLQERDVPELLAMVARHEGEESAQWAAFWLKRHPEGARIWCETRGSLAGFLLTLPLHELDPADRERDPALRAAWNYLQSHAPLRRGEGSLYFRFWIAADSYQAVSPIQSLIFINVVRYYLVTPALAYTFFPCADPDFWAMVLAYADVLRLPAVDFDIGGRRHGVFGHDWRVLPPLAWLALLAEREIAATPPTTPVPSRTGLPPKPAQTLVVLSREDFEKAAEDALRHYARPDRLVTNPLVNSRLVAAEGGLSGAEAQRAARLHEKVKAAADRLHATARDEKLYRALDRTYFHPAPTQEAAAEILDLPFSTYRRHLRAGIDQVVEILWQWEIGSEEG